MKPFRILLALFIICVANLVQGEASNHKDDLDDLNTNLEEHDTKSEPGTSVAKDERHIYTKLLALEESMKALNGKVQNLENSNKKLSDKLNKLLAAPASKPILSPINEAKTLIENRKYESATKVLLEYVQANPGLELDEAYYFLGKAYLGQNLYQKAGSFFLKYYKDYPEKPKASLCLLNVAKTLRHLNKSEKACSILDRIEQEYPTRNDSEKTQWLSEKRLSKCSKAQLI